jgi:hypothetical protein
MEKIKIQELSDSLIALTKTYTDEYFKFHKGESLDKMQWAALHCGFLSALIAVGYSKEVTDMVLKKTQEFYKDIIKK